jgi:hypothetical protein
MGVQRLLSKPHEGNQGQGIFLELEKDTVLSAAFAEDAEMASAVKSRTSLT